MKRYASTIGLAVTGLCVGVGCPQLKDDDFRPQSANVGGGGTAGGAAGAAGGEAIGGSGGTGGNAGAAASAGASDGAPQGGGGTEADSGAVDCGLDAVTGPSGGCYFADRAERTWSAARASCQSRGVGWDLVTINDADENAFVLSITGYEAWIGATDVVSEGVWSWPDEAAPFFEADAGTDSGRFTNWSAGEPNDYDDSDCLRILTTGLWADFPCNTELGHVCRRP